LGKHIKNDSFSIQYHIRKIKRATCLVKKHATEAEIMNNTTSLNKTKFQEFSNSAAFFCAIAFMIFIPVNIVLMNVFLFLVLIFTLMAGDLKHHLTLVWHNPVTKAALILFALLGVSVFWSIAETDWSLRVLKKYNELWYIALLLPLFHSPQRRNIGINAFLIGMGLILTGIYLVYFNVLPSSGISIAGKHAPFTVDGGFSSHIMTNILMSFVVFVSAHKVIFSNTKIKWLYGALFSGSFYYALFISTGTTGQLITLSLLGLLLIQYFGKKSLILLPILVLFISIITINTENNAIKHAIHKIESRISHIENGNPNTRPQLAIHAFKLFAKDPVIGTGVGSYRVALETKQSEFSERTPHKWNPHNEYLVIAVQLGLIGLLALLFLFYTQAKSTQKIQDKEQRYLAHGLVLLFVIGCLGNSLIMDSGEGHFWAFFSAFFFSNLLVEKKKTLSI